MFGKNDSFLLQIDVEEMCVQREAFLLLFALLKTQAHDRLLCIRPFIGAVRLITWAAVGQPTYLNFRPEDFLFQLPN